MQKVIKCLILSERSYYIFAHQGFITKHFLIFIVDGVKNFATNNLLQVGVLVTYQEPCIDWLVTYQNFCIHLLKSSQVLKQQKVSAVSSSKGIVESRDKCFVLDLKLLFTIVDCFSRRFPPQVFYYETSLFHWFFWVIISCLIYFFDCA